MYGQLLLFDSKSKINYKQEEVLVIMGSTAQAIKIIRGNGEVLPEQAIKQLRTAVKCDVMFKGEADEEAYRAAIDRFNKGKIQEAVSVL
jgi:hypothetical protein